MPREETKPPLSLFVAIIRLVVRFYLPLLGKLLRQLGCVQLEATGQLQSARRANEGLSKVNHGLKLIEEPFLAAVLDRSPMTLCFIPEKPAACSARWAGCPDTLPSFDITVSRWPAGLPDFSTASNTSFRSGDPVGKALSNSARARAILDSTAVVRTREESAITTSARAASSRPTQSSRVRETSDETNAASRQYSGTQVRGSRSSVGLEPL